MLDLVVGERLRLKLLLLDVRVLGRDVRLVVTRWLRVALLLLLLLRVRKSIGWLLIARRVRCSNRLSHVAPLWLRWLLKRRWLLNRVLILVGREMRCYVIWQRRAQRLLVGIENRPGWALSSG